MTVPTSENGGFSGSAGFSTPGGGGGGGAAATVGGGGGRRDAENNGRSRVAESIDIGMAHNGLPVIVGSAFFAGALRGRGSYTI